MIGRVEVKIRKKWYGVCGIGFSTTAAEVLCRELGLGYAKRAFTSDRFGTCALPSALSPVIPN